MADSRVVLFLPSLAGGGAERVFVELANEFAAQGLSVDLALSTAEGPFLSEVADAVRIVDLKSNGVLRSLPRLTHHLRRERPAAILSALDHANSVSVASGFLARSNTRCVVSTRGVPSMLGLEAGRAAAWAVLQTARVAYRLADAIIANSQGVADDLASFLRIPRSRIAVVYNPLNLEVIERASVAPVAHRFCAPGAPPLILSVGRLSPLKDFPTLIRAFSTLRARRDCRLAILGEGPDRAALEGLVDDLGIGKSVALPGFESNPYAWMRRAGLFVSSSLSEGCPNALMQALACGTPVVSTDAVGGSAEVLEGGKWGRVVPVGDTQELARAMDETLDSKTRPDVRLRAADFALERVARDYLAILLPGQFAPAGGR